MFQIKGSSVVIFSKFFSEIDATTVLASIPDDANKVLFVDTGATPDLVKLIKALHEKELTVFVRDHHKGEGRNPESAEAIQRILGDRAKIVDRKSAPGCAQLVETGEFADADVIVADPDYDGLVAAMKAQGVSYEGMDDDAEIFDVRPKQSAETLTELGWTAVRALSTLPPFNKDRPEVSEKAKKELFEEFISAASGDEVAYAEMKSRVAIYEAAVTVAEKLLLEKITKPCKGVALVDSVGAGKADLNTLVRGMETEEIVVTVVRKDFGPIAGNPGKHGVQYSLAVKREQQDKLDLRELLPENMEKSPQAGILSNVPFLLHCSEQIWHDVILPALKSRLD